MIIFIEKLVMPTKEINIFTDGSYIKATKACGYGVLFPNGEYSNISKPFTIEPKTNQRAELYAIYKGIKSVYKDVQNKNQENQINITIYSDSEYSIKSLTLWIINWKKNNWKTSSGKDVLNQDLIIKLDKLIEKFKANYGLIKFIHVRAHSDKKDFESINNNLVDILAKQGATSIL